MHKAEAIRLLGGTPTAVAKAIGITPQAVSGWPDTGDLPAAIRDRVQAALWRKQQQQGEGSQLTPLTQSDIDHATCGAARHPYQPRDSERRHGDRRRVGPSIHTERR